MASAVTLLVVVALGLGVYVAYKAGIFSKLIPSLSPSSSTSTPSAGSTPTTGGGATTAAVGGHIYPVVSTASGVNIAGTNQQITYASSGKAATSHRSDVPFPGKKNIEATVYLSWPTACTGGGHPELAIKFWGPGHTDATCCYCYTSAVPSGGNLQLGFGGEGPHPSTTTLQKVAKSIPFTAGKKYGIKGVIWSTGAGKIHQETWYDDGSGKWQLAGAYDRATCGQNKTSTTPAANSEVEFRIDCANVTYSGTDVVEITPPAGGGATAGLARAFDVQYSDMSDNSIDGIHWGPITPQDWENYPLVDYGHSC
jgi:hypothetical protein